MQEQKCYWRSPIQEKWNSMIYWHCSQKYKHCGADYSSHILHWQTLSSIITAFAERALNSDCYIQLHFRYHLSEHYSANGLAFRDVGVCCGKHKRALLRVAKIIKRSWRIHNDLMIWYCALTDAFLANSLLWTCARTGNGVLALV